MDTQKEFAFRRDRNMEVIQKECANCGKKIFVREEFAREQMFCTMGCMDSFNNSRRNSLLSINGRNN